MLLPLLLKEKGKGIMLVGQVVQAVLVVTLILLQVVNYICFSYTVFLVFTVIQLSSFRFLWLILNCICWLNLIFYLQILIVIVPLQMDQMQCIHLGLEYNMQGKEAALRFEFYVFFFSCMILLILHFKLQLCGPTIIALAFATLVQKIFTYRSNRNAT